MRKQLTDIRQVIHFKDLNILNTQTVDDLGRIKG